MMKGLFESILKKELDGPIGKRINRLLLDSCQRISSTKTIPPKVIKYIHTESAIKGRRPKGISKDVQAMLPHLAKDQIELICRTVASTASTDLTRARAESMGADWYVWRSSRDQRVRPAHRLMDGVIVAWKDPPSPEALNGEESIGPGHAGEGDGCRCWPFVLLQLDSVEWPHGVFSSGRIQEMTRAQFKRMQSRDSDLR